MAGGWWKVCDYAGAQGAGTTGDNYKSAMSAFAGAPPNDQHRFYLAMSHPDSPAWVADYEARSDLPEVAPSCAEFCGAVGSACAQP